ncbi:hypothetical protein [Hydrocarboniphaga sp.]|uniref:hypothetical protein n=1 Tax=Hydrocarboniphaga sp. TaxID=2033016 RepID=UPI003D129648
MIQDNTVLPGDDAPTWAHVAAQIALAARAVWQARSWPAWKEFFAENASTRTPSADTSVVTSFALHGALVTALPQIVWRVVGGRPEKRRDEFGYHDGRGWRPHLWVVGRADGIRLIVDITSDQFGGPDVVVTETEQAQYLAHDDVEALEFYARQEADAVAMLLDDLADSLAAG